jgi:hypothetical protein
VRRRQAHVRELVTFALVLGAVLLPATPAAAAEFLNDGFEAGLGQWTSTVNFTAQQAVVKNGSWAGRATTSANDANASKTLAAVQSNFYVRAFVNVISHTGSTPIMRVRTSTGAVILTVNVNATEKLATNNAITGVNRQSTTTITPGFHEIQVHTRINGANGQVEVWFDGAPVAALNSAVENLGTNAVGRFLLGRSGSSTNPMDIAYDDVIAADQFITGGGGTPPATPANLHTTSVASNQVNLAWDASTGATFYNVNRSTDGVTFGPVGSPTGTTFADNTVSPSTTYYYTVEACNGSGCSTPSAPPVQAITPAAGGPPATPGNFRTTLVQSNRVDLAWDASAGATSYNVRRNNGAPVNKTGTTHSDTSVVPDTNYSYTVDACNTNGCSPQSTPLLVHTPPVSGAGTVVMAAGDIACDPADANFNNGNGTASKCRQKFTGNLVTAANPDHVLPIGDTQYDCAGTQAYAQSYNTTGWGAAKNISHPILSDEDYDTAGTNCGAAGPDGYRAYFGAQAPADYYTVDDAASGWRFIALNSECADVIGGCGEGSPQNNFLEASLNPNQCTIAMLHKPRFRSKVNGAQVTASMLPFWQDLTAGDAEILLGGDSHFYERFNPMDVNGNFKAGGTVQFVVGVGGKSRGGLAAPSARHPQHAKGTSATFGVLKLTLHPNSYDWQFVVEGSNSFTDSGSANC